MAWSVSKVHYRSNHISFPSHSEMRHEPVPTHQQGNGGPCPFPSRPRLKQLDPGPDSGPQGQGHNQNRHRQQVSNYFVCLAYYSICLLNTSVVYSN